MTVRFLADEDINWAIVQGLRSREPAVDILDVKSSGLRGSADPVLLELAANEGRVLVTSDQSTMPRHFRNRVDASLPAPGLFILPQLASVGQIIESLLLIWSASEAAEWKNQIVYLPFR